MNVTPKNKGMSLVEVMVSMAIMSSILVASSYFLLSYVRLTSNLQAGNQAKMESRLLTEYLSNQARKVGGTFVRPWMGLWIEDNCIGRDGLPDCAGGDRITMGILDSSVATCQVLLAEAPNRLHFDLATPNCCSVLYEKKQVIMAQTSIFGQFYVTGFFSDAANCYIDITAGQAYGINALAPPALFTDWTGSNIQVANIKTFYVDPNTQELSSFEDINNNLSVDAGESTLLADQVFDLQISLGYDVIPQDGYMNDQGNDTDEWQFNFNSANDTMGVGGLLKANLADMRMIAISIISGAKSPLTNSVFALNGPIRKLDHWRLASSTSKIYLRSTLVFY